MSTIGQDFQLISGAELVAPRTAKRKSPRHKITRDCPRVTLRFSLDDYERLKQLADGVALATYIRAKALGDGLPRRKPRSRTSIANKQALAQILGLLGQSKMANNLNQLAYHVNIGTLVLDEDTQARISEAYEHILFLRNTLIKALGL